MDDRSATTNETVAATEEGLSLEELNGQVNLPPPPSIHTLILRFLKDWSKQPRADIWRFPVPAALVNGVSLLEYSQHYGDHPQLLADIPRQGHPRERMLAAVKWYIATLYGSYGSRAGGKEGGFERKPYNPVLGEQFRCRWETQGVRADLVAEQVSHHPPVSAFHIQTDNGVHVQGYTGQSISLGGVLAIKVRQEGRIFVYLEEPNEEIVIALPELHLYGLTSTPYVEITGTAYLVSSADWAADLVFSKSTYFSSDKKDEFEGYIYPYDSGRPEYYIQGNWKKEVWVERVADDSAARQLLFSHADSPAVRPVVAPLREQSSLESRRMWAPVTRALMAGDYGTAETAKKEIEDRQRRLREERIQKGMSFTPALFSFTDAFMFLPVTSGDLSGQQLSDFLRTSDGINDAGSGCSSSSSPISSNSSNSSTTSSNSVSSNSTDSISYNGRWLSKSLLAKHFRAV